MLEGMHLKNSSVLFDFSQPNLSCNWQPITDTVMGGHSTAEVMQIHEGVLCFRGQLHCGARGGFASIRCAPHRISLHGWHGLLLRVRGDGKRYHLRLRPNDGLDGLSYQAAFQTTAGDWREYSLLFEEFIPIFRNWKVMGAPPLPLGHIYSLGFVIADRQSGLFELHVEWIALFRHEYTGAQSNKVD